MVGMSECVVASPVTDTSLSCDVAVPEGGLQDVSFTVAGVGRALLSQSRINVSGNSSDTPSKKYNTMWEENGK